MNLVVKTTKLIKGFKFSYSDLLYIPHFLAHDPARSKMQLML